MNKKTVDILGTEYEIKTCMRKDDEYMHENNLEGYCSNYEKIIVVVDKEDKEYFKYFGDNKEAVERLFKQTVRHEIFHAYLNESGLSHCSSVPSNGWAKNEEMIDWLAIQSPKIFKTFQELDIL